MLRLHDRVELDGVKGTVSLARWDGVGVDFDDGQYVWYRRALIPAHLKRLEGDDA